MLQRFDSMTMSRSYTLLANLTAFFCNVLYYVGILVGLFLLAISITMLMRLIGLDGYGWWHWDFGL